jgi:peroxiredoxin
MTEAITPGQGLAVLHLFCKVTPLADTDGVLVAARALRAAGHEIEADEHQLVAVALLGHKADVGFLAIGPDMWRLRQFQTDVEAAGLTVVDSYLSLTELSEYAANLPEERKQARLFPRLPPEGKPAFCFYPMSKRREAHANWYATPFEQRLDMMMEHGSSGRKFAGRVVQVVTASTGLDDFEWGVTLFANDLDVVKDVVYTMRFDRGSALYGEFGRFFVGYLDDVENLV